MEGTLIDNLTDRERSAALRPKHTKKDKITMKSIGYPPPEKQQTKFFKPLFFNL